MTKKYDVIVIGGGLAGLAATILLSRAQLSVLLVEKNNYPFHKVCGEYISNETLPFLNYLGVNPFALGAVALEEFELTAPQTQPLLLSLPLGGFGLSRYVLDSALALKAKEAGAEILTQTQVKSLTENSRGAICHTTQGDFEARYLLATFGKRSNLDTVLDRNEYQKKANYIGVKYHIRYPKQPFNRISLHNFENGYCGISRIENDSYCLCYLSHKKNLAHHKKLDLMEREILAQNPFLADIFQNATFLYDHPLVIHQVSFAAKNLEQPQLLFAGDAAGMIAPLCGNGMSMALLGGGMAAGHLVAHLQGRISAAQMVSDYKAEWRKTFALRLWAGRTIQHFFGDLRLSRGLISFFRYQPFLAKQLIKLTHGNVPTRKIY
ncbi:NAD(P)/FAD-dependent oxidoreductase [Hugenholtzia roseola]|uniref:NAD(P)/FAD-dependent oxidoreductase n=1 Tax=Hugenholtzia roseola TaxID=1002 RepID=UPI000419C13B|nr:NAD(P)/FAD-dependent oxidoreductase [Hugenholtzia roseola]